LKSNRDAQDREIVGVIADEQILAQWARLKEVREAAKRLQWVLEGMLTMAAPEPDVVADLDSLTWVRPVETEPEPDLALQVEE
jgi:hypothetical protein